MTVLIPEALKSCKRFNWSDLDGKTLQIRVNRDVTNDQETTVVMGREVDTGKFYLLNTERVKFESIHIMVNGKMMNWHKDSITYHEACQLAEKNPDVLQTITYKTASGKQGTLVPDQKIALDGALRMEVHHTGNA